MVPAEFMSCIMTNAANVALLQRLSSLSLNQCYLTAGCLFQTVWNHSSAHAPDWGIRDYDVFYHDDHDTSWEAEDVVIRRVNALAAGLGIRVETRNQARVHLWYEQRFGGSYPELASARDGIDRFLVACTCVGVEIANGDLYAPNGLEDLQAGVLRANPLYLRPDLFRRKAEDYRARWPWLRIVD